MVVEDQEDQEAEQNTSRPEPVIEQDHREIFQAWPSLSAFADDLGIPYNHAKFQRRRGWLPAWYWIDVVRAARRRGIRGITLTRLAEIASRHPNRVHYWMDKGNETDRS